jgi:hypothetical protein
MAATATARTSRPRAPRAATTPRRPRAATARTAAPRRAPRSAPVPRLVPVAVGRTAVAVGGMADSGVVLRLTRSRLWIGVLGTLLVGIVALNVFALSFNASSSKTAGLADELRRENSALATQIADGLSNERVQQAAARLGLVVPEPGAILYLEPQAGDAARAANRLEKGAITVGTEYVPPPPIAAEPVVTETVTDPATTETVVTETTVPAEQVAAATEPPATAPTTANGGVTLTP